MVALYLTSMESAGKTTLCAGIGKKLVDEGEKVGFMTPIQLSNSSASDGMEGVSFIKKALELTESIEQLSPITLPLKDLWQNLTDDLESFTQKMKQSYAKVSADKDVVLLDGLGGLGANKVSTLACYTIAEILDVKVIIVLRYSPGLNPSEIVKIREKLGQRMLGVIINLVPESRMKLVNQDKVALFQEAGIKVLGVIPEVRNLLGVSVSELAEALGGEILTCSENADGIVENVMLGAMTPDSGVDYFSRKANKAAVIRGERADMQLAALATSTRCLILTGDLKPKPAVVYEAEDKHVPIIVVKQGTSEVIDGIEDALAKATFYSSGKLRKFEYVLDSYLGFQALYTELSMTA